MNVLKTPAKGRAYLFLDRDGTLIEDRHYLADPEGVVLAPRVTEGLQGLARLGFRFVVVSNQSGIGRGYFSLHDAQRVNDRLAQELAAHGIEIDAWFVCPHHPEARCACRKPASGLIDQARKAFDVDMAASAVIGDKDVDLDLARGCGIRGILITYGYTTSHSTYARNQGDPVFSDMVEIYDYFASIVNNS